MLHPDEAVSILVTDVENLLQPPQKLQELLVVRKNVPFHFSSASLDVFLDQILRKRVGFVVAIIAASLSELLWTVSLFAAVDVGVTSAAAREVTMIPDLNTRTAVTDRPDGHVPAPAILMLQNKLN